MGRGQAVVAHRRLTDSTSVQSATRASSMITRARVTFLQKLFLAFSFISFAR